MKRKTNNRVVFVFATVLVACFAVGSLNAQQAPTQKIPQSVAKKQEQQKAPIKKEDEPGCIGGIWAPTPISQIQTSTSDDKASFNTLYAVYCGGKIYLVRLQSYDNDNLRKISIDNSKAFECKGTVQWFPAPAGHWQNRGGDKFDTSYGLSCNGTAYLVWFYNSSSIYAGQDIAVFPLKIK